MAAACSTKPAGIQHAFPSCIRKKKTFHPQKKLAHRSKNFRSRTALLSHSPLGYRSCRFIRPSCVAGADEAGSGGKGTKKAARAWPVRLLCLLRRVAYFAESAGAASAAGAAATVSATATVVSVGVSTTSTAASSTTAVVSALASLLPLPQDARDTAARATAKNMIFFIVLFI